MTDSTRRLWLLLGLAALLRLPLVFLPALGRDEAAYLYWAFHPEPTYAPLLQLLLRLVAAIDPAPWLLRAPGFLVGLVTIALLDRFLRIRGEPLPLLATAAIVLSPWATYATAVTHPDALFVLATIGFALAERYRRMSTLALCAVLGVAAKPSGVLLLVVAITVLLRDRRGRSNALAGVILIGGALWLLSVSSSMWQGWTSFASLESALPWWSKALIGALSTVVLGGVPLVVAGLSGWNRRHWSGATLAGAGYVLGFGIFAVVTGQVKGNWALPGLILLWPPGGLRWPTTWFKTAVVSTAASSALLTVLMSQPTLVERIESRLPGLAEFYNHHAGRREATVSATRTWTHRFREYQPMDQTVAALRMAWGGADPKWIVSDDYGLAAQLASHMSRSTTRIVLPKDPIFARTVDQAEPMQPIDGILYVGVQTTPVALAQEMRHPWNCRRIADIAHPVTGHPVQLGRARAR